MVTGSVVNARLEREVQNEKADPAVSRLPPRDGVFSTKVPSVGRGGDTPAVNIDLRRAQNRKVGNKKRTPSPFTAVFSLFSPC